MRIFTHAGMFHADDALATAIVQHMYPHSDVCRVFAVPADLDPEDFVIDIGGIYSPDQNKFDHHQKGGSDDGLAAAGKVWSQFGAEICGGEAIADRVYTQLIGSIDRSDIGVPDWARFGPNEWQHLSASTLISSMNAPMGSTPQEQMERFLVARDAMAAALKGAIENSTSFFEMKKVVEIGVQFCPEVLCLAQGGPWQEHVLTSPELGEVAYVIYPSDRGGFILQCVPDALGSFGQRKGLPKAWAGLRGIELQNLLRLQEQGSATFCHPGGFICGAETLTDTLKMAELAVAAN